MPIRFWRTGHDRVSLDVGHKGGRRKVSLRFWGPGSKLGSDSWSDSLIVGIHPAASAWRHVLMSPPYKIIYIYNIIVTALNRGIILLLKIYVCVIESKSFGDDDFDLKHGGIKLLFKIVINIIGCKACGDKYVGEIGHLLRYRIVIIYLISVKTKMFQYPAISVFQIGCCCVRLNKFTIRVIHREKYHEGSNESKD